MLALTRRETESIYITCPDGTKIQIKLLEANYRRARIGFVAPKEYVISREELLEEHQRVATTD